MQFVLISLNDDVDFICIEKEKIIAINEYYISQLIGKGAGYYIKIEEKISHTALKKINISYIKKKNKNNRSILLPDVYFWTDFYPLHEKPPDMGLCFRQQHNFFLTFNVGFQVHKNNKSLPWIKVFV